MLGTSRPATAPPEIAVLEGQSHVRGHWGSSPGSRTKSRGSILYLSVCKQLWSHVVNRGQHSCSVTEYAARLLVVRHLKHFSAITKGSEDRVAAGLVRVYFARAIKRKRLRPPPAESPRNDDELSFSAACCLLFVDGGV